MSVVSRSFSVTYSESAEFHRSWPDLGDIAEQFGFEWRWQSAESALEIATGHGLVRVTPSSLKSTVLGEAYPAECVDKLLAKVHPRAMKNLHCMVATNTALSGKLGSSRARSASSLFDGFVGSATKTGWSLKLQLETEVQAFEWVEAEFTIVDAHQARERSPDGGQLMQPPPPVGYWVQFLYHAHREHDGNHESALEAQQAAYDEAIGWSQTEYRHLARLT